MWLWEEFFSLINFGDKKIERHNISVRELSKPL